MRKFTRCTYGTASVQPRVYNKEGGRVSYSLYPCVTAVVTVHDLLPYHLIQELLQQLLHRGMGLSFPLHCILLLPVYQVNLHVRPRKSLECVETETSVLSDHWAIDLTNNTKYAFLYTIYSGKFSRGSIFTDRSSLPFHGFNFCRWAHSCTVLACLFRV